MAKRAHDYFLRALLNLMALLIKDKRVCKYVLRLLSNMHLMIYYILTTSQPHANDKGSDQSAYNRCLICAYDVPCLDRIKRFLDSGLICCSDFYKGLDLAT